MWWLLVLALRVPLGVLNAHIDALHTHLAFTNLTMPERMHYAWQLTDLLRERYYHLEMINPDHLE